MKKVLSMVLVIAMMLSTFSFAFAAVELTDIEGSDNQKAIETLVSLGIINGYEDGTFREDNTVTRGEMAKLLVVALGYGNLVGGASSDFSDMKDPAVAWADGYVALAAGRNIVNGYPDGTFKANQVVTFDEAITMIVRALGYTDDCNELRTMSWPTNYKVKAAELNLTKDVVIATAGADRGSVAQLIYNALTAPLVTVDTDGNVSPIINTSASTTEKVNESLLSRLAVRDVVTIVPEMLDEESLLYAGDFVDLMPYMYQTVEVYFDKNDYADNEYTVLHVGKGYDDVYEGTFKRNGSSTNNYENNKINVKLTSGATKTLSTTDNIPVFFNGEETIYSELLMENGSTELTSLVDANVVVVTNDAGDVEAIVAIKATFGDRIAKVYKEDAVRLSRINLPVNDDDDVDLTEIGVTGVVEALEDILVDDVVMAYVGGGWRNDYAADHQVVLSVVRDTLEGLITRTNTSENTVHIDGTSYSVSAIDGTVNSLPVGEEGTFYLDDAGKVFAFDGSRIRSAKDYAVIIQLYDGSDAETGVIRFKPEIKLINEEGSKVTYVVNSDATFEDPETGDEDGDIVSKDGKDLKTVITGGKLDSGMLVKYSLNENNEIVSIAILDQANNEVDKDTTATSFVVSTDGVIFNVPSPATTTASDYSVMKVEDLPKTVQVVTSDRNDDGEYDALVLTGAKVTKNNFGLITKIEYVLNADDDKVFEVTYYQDGELKTTNAKSASDSIFKGLAMSKYKNAGFISKISISSSEITEVAKVVAVNAASTTTDNVIDITLDSVVYSVSAEINKAKNATLSMYDVDFATGKVDYTSTTLLDLNDDVVVYVVNKDNEFVEVGTLDDVKGATLVNAYDTVNKDGGVGADGKIDILIVK